MNRPLTTSCLLLAGIVAATRCFASDQTFTEKDGILAFEAEHFHQQTATVPRQWYITSADSIPDVPRDVDPPHLDGASGGAYIEVLPDTRQNHDEPLIHGENFSDIPGAMAVLHYRVHFSQPGRYYVWIRAYSTNSEDDAVHVGLDGEWPESGKRWRTTIDHQWGWQNKRRFPPGVAESTRPQLRSYLDVETAGDRVFQISMREDGAELDKIVLVLDENYEPTGLGPESKVKTTAKAH